MPTMPFIFRPMQKPRILSTSSVASSRLFKIESKEIEFSNGNIADFECIRTQGSGVVMVAAINQQQELMMVREYAAASDVYELGFVKGKIDPHEAAIDAAGRELIEEIGYGAKQVVALRSVTMSPGYTDFLTHLYCATDLYAAEAEGDEAEPLELVRWPLAEIDALLDHHQVNDARVLFLISLLARTFNQVGQHAKNPDYQQPPEE